MNLIKMHLLVICFVSVGITSLFSQNAKTPPLTPPLNDSNKVYIDATVRPKFPGNIKKYLADSVRYPEDAMKKKIEGVVYISVVIEKNGSISSIMVLRSPDISLSNEAKRLISAMPKWIPGKQNGKPVRVQETVPVSFKL